MTNALSDIINGAFELGGGFLCWLNVKKLLKDRKIEGVYWPVQGFFAVWGVWNIFYYSNLNQWCSFYGGIFLAAGNLTWVALAIYFDLLEKSEDCVQTLLNEFDK